MTSTSTPVSASTESANRTLTSLLGINPSSAGATTEYVISGLEATEQDIEDAAQLIADDAMRIRCGLSPVLQLWRTRRDGGPEHTTRDRRAAETFVQRVFGLPGRPGDTDHLQGHVAELLWGRLINERTVCADGRCLVHATEVKADPTEPGGDGLVVYAITDGTLVFRLWEVKKHNSTAHISSTIGRACTQLSTLGAQYLALLVASGTKYPGALGKLYAELVELWLDEHVKAGVGISISTSAPHAPKSGDAFGGMAKAFPQFNNPGQREGLLIAVSDFPSFAERVREIIWTGL